MKSLLRKVYRTIFPRTLPDYYARKCPVGESGEDVFTCNICGEKLKLIKEKVTREAGNCPVCHSYSRLRAVIFALLEQQNQLPDILNQCMVSKDLKGLGFSDAEAYADSLARIFDYQNTFYDQEPKLDLMDVDWQRYSNAGFDFLICSDVMEHVPPPVGNAFKNLKDLLKPKGVLILTVPTTDEAETREHFPDLHDWKVVQETTQGKPQNVLLNTTSEGKEERFDDLCFHGGGGLTLEMRVYSRKGLLKLLEECGLKVQKILEASIPDHGISLEAHNIVIVATKAE